MALVRTNFNILFCCLLCPSEKKSNRNRPVLVFEKPSLVFLADKVIRRTPHVLGDNLPLLVFGGDKVLGRIVETRQVSRDKEGAKVLVARSRGVGNRCPIKIIRIKTNKTICGQRMINTSVKLSVLCRISRSNFCSGQCKKYEHSHSYKSIF